MALVSCLDLETSEPLDLSASKRRRRDESGDQGTCTGTTNASTSHHEMGTAISKSACIIAEAIQTIEEREERRHRELMSLHEKRLRIEESKLETNKKGINGLVHAINKLANSINTLAFHHNQSSPN
ncbi:uncharacterized protein LOC109004687 [Juglans regia]|uniref:Uncharacterized protein LOC109004687 n=1 Tax=Juglans regia TaxID=51240 RepID=A0A6P9ECE4_JUGRE|nr:uncharacterized protein LOC109004687 [Juglans regia]